MFTPFLFEHIHDTDVYKRQVKLNLQNPAVADYLLQSVEGWVKEFDIDGLRLDVAYSLDENFVRRLRSFCDGLKPDFFLLGEMLHGDYNLSLIHI